MEKEDTVMAFSMESTLYYIINIYVQGKIKLNNKKLKQFTQNMQEVVQ